MTKERVSLYARISSDEQRKGVSLDAQIDLLKRYASKEGYEIVGVFSEVISGTLGLLDRPALYDAIRSNPDVLIFRDEDRFLRENKYEQEILNLIKEREIFIEYVYGGRILDAFDEVEQSRAFLDGKLEALKITRRTRDGRIYHTKELGSVLVATAPFGYDKTGEYENRGLKPNPDEAAIVKEIYKRYAKRDVSLSYLAEYLNDNEIPTPSGRGKWHRATVRRILSSPTYIGQWQYRKTIKPDKDTIIPNDPEDIITVPIPPIVDKSTFEKVQSKLSDNRKHKRRQYKNPYPLRGRIRCMKCGRTLSKSVKKHTLADGTPTTYSHLICCGVYSKKCDTSSFNAKEIESTVLVETIQMIQSPENLEKILDEMEEDVTEFNMQFEGRLEAIDRDIKSAEKSLEKTLQLTGSTTASQESIQNAINKADRKIERLANERLEILNSYKTSPDVDREFLREMWAGSNFDLVHRLSEEDEYYDLQLQDLKLENDDVTDMVTSEQIQTFYEELDLQVKIGRDGDKINLFLSAEFLPNVSRTLESITTNEITLVRKIEI